MNDARIAYDAERLGREIEEYEQGLTPIGGRLEPEDIAPMVVYLAGDDGAHDHRAGLQRRRRGEHGMSSVAVVTGGARGIGWAVGKHLRDEGWQVVAADLVPGETEAGDTGIAYRQMDVCDREQVSSTLAAVVDEYGGLDLLVNNAGITRHRPLVDLTLGGLVGRRRREPPRCLQLPAGRRPHHDRAGGGVIVNMASVAAERGAAGRAPYATTKAAVVGLTRSAAVEWAPHGVRVNAVGPGYVDTGVLAPPSPRARSTPPRCSSGSPPAGSPTRTRSARW